MSETGMGRVSVVPILCRSSSELVLGSEFFFLSSPKGLLLLWLFHPSLVESAKHEIYVAF